MKNQKEKIKKEEKGIKGDKKGRKGTNREKKRRKNWEVFQNDWWKVFQDEWNIIHPCLPGSWIYYSIGSLWAKLTGWSDLSLVDSAEKKKK